MIDDPSTHEAGATGNIDGINAEALMGQIQSGQAVQAEPAQVTPTPQTQTSTPAPQGQGQTAPAQAQTQPTASGAPPWEKDTIKINGQEFTATRAQILQWAAQGRTHPQVMEKLKARETELEAKYKPYAEIDQFARSNPDWWNEVTQSYQQKKNTPAVPPELQSKIDELTKFQSDFKTEQAQKTLDAEIQDIRKEYPDLSWDALDEQGTSLEMRVYDHAIAKGIQSFQTAFRDLMFPQIVKYHVDRAKEQAVKELQAQRKSGLIGVTTTSQHQTPSAPQKFKNYDDAGVAALAEYGIQAG